MITRIWLWHLCSLSRAFAVRTHEVWKKTKGPTKNQTSSPTGCLNMHFWRMHLRRMKRAIISWNAHFEAQQFWPAFLLKLHITKKANNSTEWLSQTTDISKYFVWSPWLWNKDFESSVFLKSNHQWKCLFFLVHDISGSKLEGDWGEILTLIE